MGMIYTNIARLCRSRGISIARLERELGFGNATIRGWAASSPTVEKLKAAADYFGVTVDALLSPARDGPPSPREPGGHPRRG